jgi:16S rRNA (adenine1518-N6/adenine1519-N6)-dimethyltransferase
LKAKKHLGQHFLTDQNVVSDIIDLIKSRCAEDTPLLEVGPGQGALTFALAAHFPFFKALEFDRDMISVLEKRLDADKFIAAEFLSFDFNGLFDNKEFNLVGNFPYNISSQIIFKMIDNFERIPLMVGMFQKEVAERICATPGGKKNGILSLRVQAFYDCELVFNIAPDAFDPPPKVNSSIIVLTRKKQHLLDCDPATYARLIKTSFSQRRKKMRNTLQAMVDNIDDPIFQKRPEELSVEEFVNIARNIKTKK